MARMVIESRSAYEHGQAEPHTAAYLFPAVVAVVRHNGLRRVLDIGCGNGALSRLLLEAGCEVVGIEPSASGVRAARANAPGAVFHELGVYDDPATLADDGFDGVVSTDVVEHLYAPEALPRFAAAKLRPGGLLILTTPYHGYLKNIALSVLGAWDRHHAPLWTGGHIKFWSRRSLARLLTENGFDVASWRGLGRLPFFWKSLLVVARKPPAGAADATAAVHPS